MVMVVACVFHVLLFEVISSASPLVPQSVPPTLMVFLLFTLSLKACNGHLVFSFLCFSLIKTLIFLPYSFSIFILIIKIILRLFEFVFNSPDLSLSELEVPLAMSFNGDVCGLGATCYILSMDWKLPSIIVVSNRVVLKLIRREIFMISTFVLYHFSYISSYFIDIIDFYQVFCIMYHGIIRIIFDVYKTF